MPHRQWNLEQRHSALTTTMWPAMSLQVQPTSYGGHIDVFLQRPKTVRNSWVRSFDHVVWTSHERRMDVWQRRRVSRRLATASLTETSIRRPDDVQTTWSITKPQNYSRGLFDVEWTSYERPRYVLSENCRFLFVLYKSIKFLHKKRVNWVSTF